MLMMLDCQKLNARTWALSAIISFSATPSLNFYKPPSQNRRGFSLDSLHAGHVESDPQQQQHHQQLLHHYYSPGDQVKDQGLVLPLSHQQDHHGHHLTAAGLMQAVAAEIQLNEDQDQLNPNATQNSPYPIYSYYRSEGERANNGSPGADLPWR